MNVGPQTHALFKYSQRAMMKTARFIKLRTFSRGPEDLALEMNRNPLKRTVHVLQPTHTFTSQFLDQFKSPLDIDKARKALDYDPPISLDEGIRRSAEVRESSLFCGHIVISCDDSIGCELTEMIWLKCVPRGLSPPHQHFDTASVASVSITVVLCYEAASVWTES